MTSTSWRALVSGGARLVAALAVLVLADRPARGEGFALIVGVNDCPAFRLPGLFAILFPPSGPCSRHPGP